MGYNNYPENMLTTKVRNKESIMNKIEINNVCSVKKAEIDLTESSKPFALIAKSNKRGWGLACLRRSASSL